MVEKNPKDVLSGLLMGALETAGPSKLFELIFCQYSGYQYQWSDNDLVVLSDKLENFDFARARALSLQALEALRPPLPAAAHGSRGAITIGAQPRDEWQSSSEKR